MVPERFYDAICRDKHSEIHLPSGECISKEDIRYKGKCVAFERKLKGLDRYILVADADKEKYRKDGDFYPMGLNEFLDEFPKNHELLDRALLNLGRRENQRFGKKLFISAGVYASALFADTHDVVGNIINYLFSNKLIEIKTEHHSIDAWEIVITPDGWARIAELQRNSGELSDKAFIAMWFNNEKNGEIRGAIEEAVKGAGYKSIVIDEKRHEDFIMNQIINEINESRFVIADFTSIPEGKDKDAKLVNGVRGGVYWEAGYARGLKKKVFHTCRKDTQDRLHFDIEQINTLFWELEGNSIKDRAKFVNGLKQTIWAEVGKGPYCGRLGYN